MSTELVAGRLSRRLNFLVLLLFALVVSLAPAGAGAQEPPAPSTASVWYSSGASLVRVDAESGTAVGSVKLPARLTPVSGLASHPTDGSVAALAKGRLVGFNASRTKTFEQTVTAATSLGTAPVLASDPHDGSLWVGGVGAIVLSDAGGQNQRTLKLKGGEAVKAIGASQDGGAYVLTPSRFLRYSEAGRVLFQRRMPSGGVSTPSRLAIDEFGGRAYLANETEVAQVDLNNATSPPIRKFRPKGGVGAISVNPFSGTLYVASVPSLETSKGTLYSYSASGALIKKVGYSAKAVRRLSFDAPSGTLWLGTDTKLLGFKEDLSRKATIGASQLGALSAAPLSLSSRLSLLEPQNGALSKDPRQPARLNLEAYCNNEVCPAGFGYGSTLGLEATLNAQDVGDLFAIQGDPGSQGGAEATLAPAQDLPEGENTLVAEAVDHFGVASNRLETGFTVDTIAPNFLEVAPPDGTVLAEGKATITGKVDDAGARVYLEGLNDLGGKIISDDPNGFSFEVPLKEGENAFRLLAYDEADNVGEQPLKLTFEPPDDPPDTEPPVDGSDPTVRSERPPDSPVPTPTSLPEDPMAVAPSVDPGTATDTADSTRFLYEGENPIQTGVGEGAIEDKRVAVLKGKVLDRVGDPVPGVRITVLDHPELGQTLTREDGQFDIAVNGGGIVTLVYEKDRYMPAQRQVETPWRDFTSLEDVVLVGFSRKVTDVDLAGTDEMLVAQGSTITDGDGTRQATVLLPKDIQAEMVLPNGATQPLPEMDFRATEYTVGQDGPEAMPAPLPSASGYTYAVELSVDEAVEAGADEVRFTKPVYNYVENFLGFPVGTDVPNGYYDREKAAWVPSQDGRVIKVLSITDGLAVLDVDGSGNPAGAAALGGLGITDEERAKLAGLYAAGQSLWRVPIDHLTPWDHNWPYGPPNGAKEPNQPPADVAGDDEDNPECQAGSIIDCQNQILGEDLNVSGSPFSLHYGSDGVPGRNSRALDIPLSGSTLPPSLKRIELEVRVAGQTFKRSFPAEPNQTYTYTWDGKDAYGRTVSGEKNVTYRVGYVYDLVYQRPANFAQSFAGLSGVPITANRTEREITLWQDGEGKVVASWDDRGQGLGGWTPDILHQYDPEEKTLRLGNGDRRRGNTIQRTISTVVARDSEGAEPAVGPDGSLFIADLYNHRVLKVGTDGAITTVAGNGAPGFSGDGGPAINARLKWPTWVEVGPDGSLYVADAGNYRVRKVAPDGIITTVAGNGVRGFSGDGGPAINANLDTLTEGAVGSDGTLYIIQRDLHRVRKVGTDGIITTVAGNGSSASGPNGDGGPAKDARIAYPQGVAVDPDGSLYITDSGFNRVRKVGTDGIITTVAGNGQPGFSGDGGPAIDAKLQGPSGIAVGLDGTLYITDYYNYRVRKVGTDGIITTVAGNGQNVHSGDGGSAIDAGFYNASQTAVGPDGTLYISTYRGVRKVASPMPGAGVNDFMVPSEDGTEIYHFDHKGMHLRTLDSVTGAVLYRFSYDGKGNLSAVEDVDGLTTTIERDASGNPRAIVAPNGERTELSLDANGYLASVSNPAGETVLLTYHGEGGLLASLTDPKNNTTRFSYDAQGRLTKDEDPAGGYKALSRTEGERGSFTASVTKSSGRKNTYAVEKLPDGSSRRRNTDASGLTTVKTIGVDGDEKVTTPDGTVVETFLGPDPRFGMKAPLVERMTVRTPGGRTKTITASRQATLAIPGDPLSATTLTETVRTGDKVWTSTWNKASRTIKDTSPQGRTVTTTLDGKSRPVLVESPEAAPESYEYDPRGRLTKVTAGTGAGARTTTYTYDSKDRVSSVTDPSGEQTHFEYDAAGRLVRQIRPDNLSVSYSYDANGNLTSVTPPGRSAHEFAYDSRNLATSYSAPQVGTEDRTTSLARDLDKLPTSETLPGGGRIEYSYDAGGRPTTVSYPGGEKSHTYNPTTGNVATNSNANGTLSYAFDGILPLSETSSGQVPGKVELKYDSDLRVSGISVNGAEISYSYDKDDLITRAGSLDVSRDPARGLVTGATLSGTTDKWTYNAFGEPDSYEALSGTTQLYKYSYKRDSLGRITEKTETIEGTSATYVYSYDDEGRLEKVEQDGAIVASYTYDANGNRLSRTTPSGTAEGGYDAQDRLTSYGGNEYGYTPAGQLQSKTDTSTGQSTTYSHDAMGNLLSATLPNGKNIEYVVDARDRRVGKKVDGQLVQRFLYQGQLSPVAELDGAGNVVSRFVYATKLNVPDYMEKGGKTYRIISDHLGSVRLVVDASTGQVAQRLDYDEFGQVINDTNPGFQPFGYAGGLYDRDTGLVRFGARDYDAETGRWVQKDPIGLEGGDANLYAYVSNDPINWVDPSGLFASVCVNGNDVSIDIPLTFAGPGATPENIDKITKGIHDHWTGTFGKYKVRTDVTRKNDLLEIGRLGGFRENRINMRAGNGRSNVSSVGGHSGVWFGGDPQLDWVAAHEAGHLMGLGDRYTDVGKRSVPHKGWTGNIMAETGGRVWEKNIEAIIKSAANKCGCGRK